MFFKGSFIKKYASSSEAYKSTIGKYHGIQSMSDVGKCYDNARMESFFATLKKEKLYTR